MSTCTYFPPSIVYLSLSVAKNVHKTGAFCLCFLCEMPIFHVQPCTTMYDFYHRTWLIELCISALMRIMYECTRKNSFVGFSVSLRAFRGSKEFHSRFPQFRKIRVSVIPRFRVLPCYPRFPSNDSSKKNRLKACSFEKYCIFAAKLGAKYSNTSFRTYWKDVTNVFFHIQTSQI